MSKNEPQPTKLLNIFDETLLEVFLQKITQNEKVSIAISTNIGDTKKCTWEGNDLFSFSVDCKLGNPQHNAISALRDIMKIRCSGEWTRKKIVPLIEFV